ncbi:MAG: GxxExxY protein [Alphaproteobacteria bacterium]
MTNVIDINLEENQITQKLMDYFLRIHKQMGAGLLESVYEECLCHILQKEGIAFERQKFLPIKFEDLYVEKAYKVDLLIEDKIIVELKSVDRIAPIHEAQILNYLKLADKKIGLLVNFNVPLIKNGVKRFVNNH